MTRSFCFAVAALCALGLAPRPAVAAESAHASDANFRCLALTVYFEARSESARDQKGVAHVVLNRRESERFPDSICAVVQEGGEYGSCQFSWYCDGASDRPKEQEAWEEAQRHARAVLSGEAPDPTDGATYYHLETVSPAWADDFTRTVKIDRHVYYRDDGEV